MKTILTALLTTLVLVTAGPLMSQEQENPSVVMNTNRGAIVLEIFADKSPITAKNFLDLVEANHYDGLIFHRVIRGFMIQAGGFTRDMEQKETGAPIKNESFNGVQNTKGTIAMARLNHPDSATAQFFINTVDNPFLNAKPDQPGYAVFGVVTEGMEVVEAIELSETSSQAGHSDVPVEQTVIHSIEIQH